MIGPETACLGKTQGRKSRAFAKMASELPSNEPLNGGDAGALSEKTMRVQQLFVKHQLGLRAFILSLEPNFTDAEDLLQEVFLVITRKANDFREGTNFFAWACTIAR